jgi:hypothetical protein
MQITLPGKATMIMIDDERTRDNMNILLIISYWVQKYISNRKKNDGWKND